MLSMSLHSLKSSKPLVSIVIRGLPSFLVPLAILLSTYLYLYPMFLGCVFPSTDSNVQNAFADTFAQHLDASLTNPLETRPHLAPFRLLVLADPQLEGDSSLPQPEDALSNKIVKHWSRLGGLESANVTGLVEAFREVVAEFVTEDVPSALRAVRKRVDLFGNDYYLAHIFRTLHWWTKPTHVTVLGDLVGSQWVDDEEFEWRGWRYWNRVFRGGRRIDDETTREGSSGKGITVPMDNPEWRTNVVNLAGNHDIGYAGDITARKMERFEQMYGRASWDLKFEYPGSRMNASTYGKRPKLHLVVLNSMLLDVPAMEDDLLNANYGYLNDVISNRVSAVEDRTDFTLLLTHVPLHKEEGLCVDAPMFEFWDEDDCTAGDCKPGGLKEQNHLSVTASQTGVLQSMFGMSGNVEMPAQGRGRPGLVLTGHDHEGCDVWHYIPNNTTFRGSERNEEEDERKTEWQASKWRNVNLASAYTGVREVTLRSMMGEFGGNAGLLSAWFDFEQGEWQYDIQMCRFGVQHIWWAVHVIDLVAVASVVLSIMVRAQQGLQGAIERRPGEKLLKVE